MTRMQHFLMFIFIPIPSAILGLYLCNWQLEYMNVIFLMSYGAMYILSTAMIFCGIVKEKKSDS